MSYPEINFKNGTRYSTIGRIKHKINSSTNLDRKVQRTFCRPDQMLNGKPVFNTSASGVSQLLAWRSGCPPGGSSQPLSSRCSQGRWFICGLCTLSAKYPWLKGVKLCLRRTPDGGQRRALRHANCGASIKANSHGPHTANRLKRLPCLRPQNRSRRIRSPEDPPKHKERKWALQISTIPQFSGQCVNQNGIYPWK